MADVQEVQLEIQGTRGSPCSPRDAKATSQFPPPPSDQLKSWQLWLRAALYSFFILAGQTIGVLLQRFYYEQGGNSKWMCTTVSTGGFPLLLPLLLFASSSTIKTPPLKVLAPYYVVLGLITAFYCLSFSYGILYLPASTFSLVCATQVAFTAILSYMLNSQKPTALTFNSIVVITFSATLLAVSSEAQNANGVSKGKFALGFILTLVGSAVFSLSLCLTQLTFQKILKKQTVFVLLQMFACTSSVATVVAVIGLFASGDWRGLHNEMKGFEKGQASYVIVLVCSAICGQAIGVGTIGLTFAVSSLFANMITVVALPLVPVFAAVFFHDKMDGVKIVAMLIAIWGFLSYIYQDYLDHIRAKNGKTSKSLSSETSEGHA